MNAIDAVGLEVLNREECMELLGSTTIGRVGFTVGALPAILPVNFQLIGDHIVFFTGPGSKLVAAMREAVVAFEVDQIDDLTKEGWSVQLVGRASLECGFLHRFQADMAHLESWAPGPLPFVVEIDPAIVTGRRLPPKRA